MDDKTFDLITKMYSEIQAMNQKFDKVDNDIAGMKTDITDMKIDITKIAIGQEKLQADIDIIAEVQKSHIGENEKHHVEIVEMLSNRIDTAEGAIRKISAVK